MTIYSDGQLYPEYIEAALALAAEQKHESVRIVEGELEELLRVMRTKIPVEGDHYKKALRVVVPTHRSIKEHMHPEWVALYYARPSSPLLHDESYYFPAAGEIVVISPYTKHAVPSNESQETRVSIALVVE